MRKFTVAIRGVLLGLSDISILIQYLIGLLVIVFSLVLKINSGDFFIVLALIFAVIVSEYFNTAIERVCNLYSTDTNQQIRDIKDLSSGAVLLTALLALILGMMIFSKYLF